MAPSNVFFDVWVNGPAEPQNETPAKRGELLRRIEALHPVAKVDGAQFVAGGRLRLRRGVDENAALRIVAELQMLGVIVEVEPNRPPEEAILALDQFQVAEMESFSGPVVDDNLLARLAPLDLDDSQVKTTLHVNRDAQTVNDPALLAARPVVATAVAKAKAQAKAQAAQTVSAAVTTLDLDDDRRFRPSSEMQAPVELQLERPIVVARPAPPVEREANPYEPISDDMPTVPHDVAKRRDAARAAEPEEPWQPVPGRIAQGALRKQPAVRIAAGIVLALGLGWLLAQPYARRVERHAAELRAEADTERYRPVDEAQQRVRQLDREAEDTESHGALGTAVIWLLIGGGAFAGWWRAT